MANQMIGESDSIRGFSPFLQLERTTQFLLHSLLISTGDSYFQI